MQPRIHTSRTWLLGAATLAAVLLACVAARPAAAAVQRIPAAAEHGRVLVFGVQGLRSLQVRSAQVRAFGHVLRLRPKVIRAALRRGRLRIVVPRSWARAAHRRRHRHHRSTPSGSPSTPSPSPSPSSQPAPSSSTPTLIVVTGPTVGPPLGGLMPPLSIGALVPSVPANAHYVSPTGDDGGPGTASQPWRTLTTAIGRLQPGDALVLQSGTYSAPGVRSEWTASGTASSPVTIMADPSGSRPVIKGYTKITGSYEHIYGLLFDGPTGRVQTPTSDNPNGEEVDIWSDAPGTVIAASEIRNAHWHAGIYLTNADGVQLIGNYIHDNGDFSVDAQSNVDHGIYWDSGNGGLIADNLIQHNVAHGIQLYPSAAGVTVTENTIVSNGKSGVIISNDAANNDVVNNVVAYNADNSIRSDSLSGSGNVVQNNVIWANGSGNFGQETAGLQIGQNFMSDPQFVGGSDFHVAPGSPAAGHALGTYAVPFDFMGKPRPSGGDIGAFQR